MWSKADNGVNTLFFWTDYCVSSITLCERCRKLYELPFFKELSTTDMFSLGWREGGEAWKWKFCFWSGCEDHRKIVWVD